MVATDKGDAVQPLKYKENWPEAREPFLAFWKHEIVARACIAVTAPQEGQVPLPSADAETQMTGIDLHLSHLSAHFRNSH